MARRDLNVLEAARCAEARVNHLLDRRSGRGLIHSYQLRRSVHAVGTNIAEAFGRGAGADRSRILRIARGEAEESIEHLHSNLAATRISPKEYWAARNLLAVVVKMLDVLTDDR